LIDPQGQSPGTRMPHVLAGLERAEREAAAAELVHFLVSRSGPQPATAVAAYREEIELGRRRFHQVGCVACHAPREEGWRLDQT
jgi:mono/diheme cytochrome c family protein